MGGDRSGGCDRAQAIRGVVIMLFSKASHMRRLPLSLPFRLWRRLGEGGIRRANAETTPLPAPLRGADLPHRGGGNKRDI